MNFKNSKIKNHEISILFGFLPRSLIVIMVLKQLMACGTDEDAEIFDSTDGNTYLITGHQDAVLKKSLHTDTANEQVRGTQFCTLYAHNKYWIRWVDTTKKSINDHYRVEVVGYKQKGCHFDKGFVPKSMIPRDYDGNSIMAPGTSLANESSVIALKDEPARVKAFLDLIAFAEFKGYVGYRYSAMWDPILYKKRLNFVTTEFQCKPWGWFVASGRYQIQGRTWVQVVLAMLQASWANKSLMCFKHPEVQDRAAIALIKGRHAYQDIVAGNLKEAERKVSWEWASLPSNRYNQPTLSWKNFEALYNRRLAYYQRANAK